MRELTRACCAQYVREKGTITLMDAIRKMSFMPAEMLERSTPAARQKGRLQEGADADIVVFDANTITDRATFEKPMEPSVGVRYLVVGGTLVVDDGKIVPDVFPGRAILGPGRGNRQGALSGSYPHARLNTGPEAGAGSQRFVFSPLPAYIRELRTVV